jgi:hypothetical protein
MENERNEILEECSECGHLHFDPIRNTYERCPVADEGCDCFIDGEPCAECGATDCPGDCYLYGPGSTFAGGG